MQQTSSKDNTIRFSALELIICYILLSAVLLNLDYTHYLCIVFQIKSFFETISNINKFKVLRVTFFYQTA